MGCVLDLVQADAVAEYGGLVRLIPVVTRADIDFQGHVQGRGTFHGVFN